MTESEKIQRALLGKNYSVEHWQARWQALPCSRSSPRLAGLGAGGSAADATCRAVAVGQRHRGPGARVPGDVLPQEKVI